MRRALVVGIDYYKAVDPLYGCVNDAYAVKSVLERNGDSTKNFDVRLITATGANAGISRTGLRTAIESLFADDSEIALLYFSGHGHIE